MRARVLIADDDASIREGLSIVLQLDGYEVLEASSGREALQVMRELSPQVVILDLMMGETSGWYLLSERASDPALRPIPVIISSGSIPPPENPLLAAVCLILSKPYSIADLESAIEDCLGAEDLTGRATG